MLSKRLNPQFTSVYSPYRDFKMLLETKVDDLLVQFNNFSFRALVVFWFAE